MSADPGAANGAQTDRAGGTAVLDRAGLDALIAVLIADGYNVVGPTVRDNAIVLDHLESGAQLPAGWGVETGPGRYRLHRRSDSAVFAHSAGAQSWKQFLHPSRQLLWSSNGNGYSPPPDESPQYAFLGVRGCDLAAIATLGGVLSGGAHPDGGYARRRKGLLVIAAGCTEPGGVCFCTSMGTGPAPGPGYDLSLTERIDDAGHRFLVDVGTAEGARVLSLLEHRPATDSEVDRRPRRGRRGRQSHGSADARRRHPDPAERQPRIAAMERRRGPLPHVRQLHDGVPDLFLHDDRRRHRPRR